MFEWDQEKNRTNIEKHGIGFLTAIRIFEGPVVTQLDNRRDYGEVRQQTIGAVANVLVILVVHTDRDGRVRVISARRANRQERKRYEEEIRSRTQP